MARYALLIRPSANRVYSGVSAALTQAELQVFGQSVLDARIRDVANATIGGVSYVTFAADGLGEPDAALLANLCAAAARAGSRGTPWSPGAARPRPSSPTPGWPRRTPGRTWGSATAWTRRSCGTS